MGQSTRQTVLECACDIYLERGLHGLSMRAIAQRAGISATAIYRHYRDKEALLVAMIDQGFRLFQSYLSDAMLESTPQERMRIAGRRYVDFALEKPGFYNLLFVASQLWPAPELPRAVQDRSDAAFRFLVDRVRDQGTDEHTAQERAQGIWALTHGLVSLYLAGKLGTDEAQFRELFATAHQQLAQGAEK